METRNNLGSVMPPEDLTPLPVTRGRVPRRALDKKTETLSTLTQSTSPTTDNTGTPSPCLNQQRDMTTVTPCAAKASLAPCPLCPQGSLPASAAHEAYSPKGEQKQLGGTSAYVVGDARFGSAIVVAHDVFGGDWGLHKQVCDMLAEGGHLVVMPYFFTSAPYSIEPFYAGNIVPQGKEWLSEFDWAHCSKILEPVHTFLDEAGITRVGAIGYCWGAWVVAKMTQDPSKCHAGVWAHPSCQVDRELYGGVSEKELAAAIRSPTLVLPSRHEPAFYSDGSLEGVASGNGVAWETVKFGDQSHGWMTRSAGWLGKYYEAGSDQIKAAVGVQRAVNASLGFYAKHLPY